MMGRLAVGVDTPGAEVEAAGGKGIDMPGSEGDSDGELDIDVKVGSFDGFPDRDNC